MLHRSQGFFPPLLITTYMNISFLYLSIPKIFNKDVWKGDFLFRKENLQEIDGNKSLHQHQFSWIFLLKHENQHSFLMLPHSSSLQRGKVYTFPWSCEIVEECWCSCNGIPSNGIDHGNVFIIVAGSRNYTFPQSYEIVEECWCSCNGTPSNGINYNIVFVLITGSRYQSSCQSTSKHGILLQWIQWQNKYR